LSIVWHESFADHISRLDQVLEHLERRRNHVDVASIQCLCIRRDTLDWDNQLRDNGEDLVASLVQKVVDALTRQKGVRLFGLAQTREKEREIVVVVQLLNVDLDEHECLPIDLVSLGIVVHTYGKVTSIVQFSET
jgi:hypothetical protein